MRIVNLMSAVAARRVLFESIKGTSLQTPPNAGYWLFDFLLFFGKAWSFTEGEDNL